MKKSAYPKWVDECTRSMHQAWVGMTPAEWGPLDFNACFQALNGAFLKKLHEAIVVLKKRGVAPSTLAQKFASPSGFRAIFYFAIYEYARSDHKLRKEAREVFDYLHKVLEEIFVKDVWAKESNVIHTPRAIDRLLREVPWSPGTPEIARLIARLGNSAAALSYALYRDYYVAESHEVYGPYDVAHKHGRGHILITKHYPKMRPVELWSHAKKFRHRNMKIHGIYENVSMSCEFIGMHTRYVGDLMNGLRRYAVEMNGKFYNDPKVIKREMEYIGEIAVQQWSLYEKFSKEDLKMQFLEWLRYSWLELFKLARINSAPTPEMKRNLKQAVIADKVILEPFMSYKEYLQHRDWEAYWLRELYKPKKKRAR